MVPRKGARFVAKTLKSAIANAEDLKEHKKEYNGMKTDRLVIKEALAQTASTLRRFTPKARGSAGPDPQAELPHQDCSCQTNRRMGQKTNPIGLRIAVNHDWRSKWYAGKKEFGKLLTEDRKIRELLKKKLESASVPQILIERAASRCRITILTARPGIVIGRKGAEIDKLKEELSQMTGKEIYVDIVEVKTPEIDAQLVAENVALQLERRVSFRRAMKKALQTAKDFGAEGIKIRCAGRLGGAELARVEQYHWGRVPLHTLRANIDYGFAEANTVYGKLGIKCWICKGDTKAGEAAAAAAAGYGCHISSKI